MTLQSTASGANPLTINEIKAEFGGPNTITSYRRGGGYVPNHDVNVNIPTSGTVRVSNFLGADKTFRCSITAGQVSINPIGAFITYSGFSTNLDSVGYSFGSILSGATYCGVSNSSLAQATLGGIYGATIVPTGIAGPGGTVYYTVLLLAGGDFTTSATWTSITLTQVTSITLNRTSATSTTYYSSGNYTKYTWGGQTVNGSGTVTVAIS